MSEKEMFEKAYERGNPQYWLNRTKPKKKNQNRKRKSSVFKYENLHNIWTS